MPVKEIMPFFRGQKVDEQLANFGWGIKQILEDITRKAPVWLEFLAAWRSWWYKYIWTRIYIYIFII